jgi:hypothetical protein
MRPNHAMLGARVSASVKGFRFHNNIPAEYEDLPNDDFAWGCRGFLRTRVQPVRASAK